MTATRTLNRAPITFVRCPVHDRIVSLNGEGELQGRCSGCAMEVAQAHRILRGYPRRRLVFA